MMFTVLVVCSWTQYDSPFHLFIYKRTSYPQFQNNMLLFSLLLAWNRYHNHASECQDESTRVGLPVITSVSSTLWIWFCRRQALTKTQLKAHSQILVFITNISESPMGLLWGSLGYKAVTFFSSHVSTYLDRLFFNSYHIQRVIRI